MTEPIAMIAVDWGTTNRRAWALGRDGKVLAERSDGDGLLAVKLGEFARSFAAFASSWFSGTARLPGTPSGDSRAAASVYWNAFCMQQDGRPGIVRAPDKR